MTSQELLARTIRRQIDSLFRTVAGLPADKLDWTPAPGSRSALSQLQEIATSVDEFWSGHSERKVEWAPERLEAWLNRRAALTDLAEIEKLTRESHERLIEYILNLPAEELSLPVEMPFPGEWLVADILNYYSWNAAYHEGQITYIKNLLEASSADSE